MLLYIFTGTLFPYIEGLDSWLFEGNLDDPYEEMFFYENKTISIDETEFWEKSYLLRSRTFRKLDLDSPTNVLAAMKEKKDMTGTEASTKEKEGKERDLGVCPIFIKDMGKAIVSAGKSLQLIRHAPITSFSAVLTDNENLAPCAARLTLSEAFCVSLAALIGHSDHIAEYIWQDNLIASSIESTMKKQNDRNGDTVCNISHPDKVWCKFLADTLDQKREFGPESLHRDVSVLDLAQKKLVSDGVNLGAFFPQNPAMSVCHKNLLDNGDAWSKLNLSRSLQLPPLNDEELRKSVFQENADSCLSKSTDFSFGFQFGESEVHRQHEDRKMLEMLFPFPTLLPSFQEDFDVSEYLPFQRNSTLTSKFLNWLQSLEPKGTLLPIVVLQKCLITYIKNQADYIGRNILSKLLHDWRLLDELAVLRAVYLLGSGDLLHHFLAVIFDKLDKGECLDDEFELNTILQESIRNSADGTLLSTPDSLVVSITKGPGEDGQLSTSMLSSTPRKSRGLSTGINVLESLKFTYKVSWPLELIANLEAIKKYNQVMIFLLKVKRAKYVLDKARRWMWKDRGVATTNCKRHWLLEQKLLHFVDAFHQYVMDRVYHSAWSELCDGVALAGSLDEVIEVHESYLLLIQRLCFVVPDKLWALIASRLNTILGLALDFYSIQQTLNSGAVSAIKARCEMEADRIERQFDECITFLLRILSLKLNVGQFPHLADLVTRINYNYFYMSDGGSLKTTSGTDTIASKLGKAFRVRTD